MKVTTVRFGTDLWAVLEREAALAGVSVSHYIREAALVRATIAATARGEDALALLAGAPARSLADARSPERSAASLAARDLMDERLAAAGDRTSATRIAAEVARRRARDTREEAHAIAAEAEQAIRRARRRNNPGEWRREEGPQPTKG